MEFVRAVSTIFPSSMKRITQTELERWGLCSVRINWKVFCGSCSDTLTAMIGDEMGLGKTLQVCERTTSCT